MNPGSLRHKVTIQQQMAQPESNETILEWQDVAKVWAAVEPLRGREYFQALETHSEVTTRVRMRYRAGIESNMRLLYGNRVMYIQSVIDPEERHRELQLMCVENNPAGPGEEVIDMG